MTHDRDSIRARLEAQLAREGASAEPVRVPGRTTLVESGSAPPPSVPSTPGRATLAQRQPSTGELHDVIRQVHELMRGGGDRIRAMQLLHDALGAQGGALSPADRIEVLSLSAELLQPSSTRSGAADQGAAHQGPGGTSQPAAGGNAAQTIAQRFPDGITVAIALRPTNPDVVVAGLLAHQPREMLSAVMGRNVHQLIDVPARTRLRDSLAAGDHPVTEEDARNIGLVLAANDSAFARAAETFSHVQPIVGGNPTAPVIGQPLLFSEQDDDAVEMVRTLSHTVGQLPGARDTGNIRHLAFFTHGWHDGLRLGRFRGGAAAFAAALGGSLTHDVTIGMYGCSAASGEHSFAQTVTENLAQAGHDVRVFGHENAAHTTGNPRGREFRAQAGQTTPAASRTNLQLVFTASFRSEQITSIAGQLGVPPATVEAIFDDASSEWLVGSTNTGDRHAAMKRIVIAHGRVASFEAGFHPDAVALPMQAAWRTEGLAVIRRALVSPPPPALQDSVAHAAVHPAPAAHAPHAAGHAGAPARREP